MKKKGIAVNVLIWMIIALVLIVTLLIIIAISRDSSYQIWEYIKDTFRFGGT